LLDKLIRKRMSSSLNLKRGSQGLYYTIDSDNENIAFDGHFPIVWAMRELKVIDFPVGSFQDHIPKDTKVTGALNCNGCRVFGSFNGVITNYCINCMTLLESIGEKCGCLCMYRINSNLCIEKSTGYQCPCKNEDCCFKTYLKGVNLWEIGDECIFEKKRHNWRQEFVRSEEELKEEEYNNMIFEDYLAAIENEDMVAETESDESISMPGLIDCSSDVDDSMPGLIDCPSEDDDSIPGLLYSSSDEDECFYRR